MLIESLPLLDQIKDVFIRQDGIKELYPPQAEAIERGLLDGKNLVISIPTAAGKTLLAEIAALKHVVELHGKVIYLSPLRALASEKYHEFQRFKPLGVKVAITSGDYDSRDEYLPKYDIIVSTNEKFDALLRHNVQWIQDQVTLVIVDECHLINDQHRGPTLETLLARLLIENKSSQIIALSATVGNADEIAEWLEAELILSDWRPVPLREGVYFNNVIMFTDNTFREITYNRKDPLTNLTLDSIGADEQVIIFTPSRRTAVSTAEKLGVVVEPELTTRDLKRLSEISSLVLKNVTDPLSEKLSQTIKRGVTFHHAGLNSIQREAVEKGFKEGIIKIICATPTLAAGVNLPAKRVIISSVFRYSVQEGSHPIKTLEYKQMVGRAGRPQFDKEGEAVLIAKKEETVGWLMENYILRDSEDIYSKLAAKPALRRNILGLVASTVVSSMEDLLNFFEKTFYGFQFEATMLEGMVREVIDSLIVSEFIFPLDSNERLKITPTGKRVSQLYLDPETAATILGSLQWAVRQEKPSINAIALLDVIVGTPDMISLPFYKKDWDLTEEKFKRYSSKLMRPVPKSTDDIEYEYRIRDFRTVLFLYDWIREFPVEKLILKYRIGSGDIHRIIETATWIVSAISELSQLKVHENKRYLKFVSYARSLSERVQYGIKTDAISLTKIKGIGRKRARVLLNHGIRDINKLKTLSINEIAQLPGFGTELAKNIIEQVKQKSEEIPQPDVLSIFE
ncbi:MAG: DEAD/DEAH box helicase [Candidatus Hodarchaeales archaeon]